jgi:hypothetical protein
MKQFYYREDIVSIEIDSYENGRSAISLYDMEGEPFATATINVEEYEVALDKVIIKDYSENRGMYKFLLRNNIILPLEGVHTLMRDKAPICQLLPESEWKPVPEQD